MPLIVPKRPAPEAKAAAPVAQAPAARLDSAKTEYAAVLEKVLALTAQLKSVEASTAELVNAVATEQKKTRTKITDLAMVHAQSADGSNRLHDQIAKSAVDTEKRGKQMVALIDSQNAQISTLSRLAKAHEESVKLVAEISRLQSRDDHQLADVIALLKAGDGEWMATVTSRDSHDRILTLKFRKDK